MLECTCIASAAVKCGLCMCMLSILAAYSFMFIKEKHEQLTLDALDLVIGQGLWYLALSMPGKRPDICGLLIDLVIEVIFMMLLLQS